MILHCANLSSIRSCAQVMVSPCSLISENDTQLVLCPCYHFSLAMQVSHIVHFPSLTARIAPLPPIWSPCGNSWITIGTAMAYRISSAIRHKRCDLGVPTTPEPFVHLVVALFLGTFLLSTIVSLIHFPIVCLYILTVVLLVWRAVLVNLGLRPSAPSTASLTTTPLILLDVVPFASCLRRPPASTFANIWRWWAWVL